MNNGGIEIGAPKVSAERCDVCIVGDHVIRFQSGCAIAYVGVAIVVLSAGGSGL